MTLPLVQAFARFEDCVFVREQEFWTGVPPSMCESSQNGGNSNSREQRGRFLEPRCLLTSQAHDITFSSVEGDFQVCSVSDAGRALECVSAWRYVRGVSQPSLCAHAREQPALWCAYKVIVWGMSRSCSSAMICPGVFCRPSRESGE